MDPFSPSNKANKLGKPGKLDNICVYACILQVVGGVSSIILSFFFLFSFIQVTGIIIGVILCIVGAVGYYGTIKRQKELLNFHVVGAILALVLSFQFIGQAGREIDVDCSLAELFIKTSVLEDISRNLARREMYDTIYSRLNEVEQSLNLVHSGMTETIKAVKDNISGSGNTVSDSQWIAEKLDVIKFYAKEIFEEFENHPDTKPEKMKDWKEEDVKRVEYKLTTASDILKRIREHEEEDKMITADEYEQLLKLLTEAYLMDTIKNEEVDRDVTLLQEQHKHLRRTQDAIVNVGNSLTLLDRFHDETDKENMLSRQSDMRLKYLDDLEKHLAAANQDIHMHMLKYMPEHCLKEGQGFIYMEYIGILTACFQFMSIYVTLCLTFRIPNKTD